MSYPIVRHRSNLRPPFSEVSKGNKEQSMTSRTIELDEAKEDSRSGGRALCKRPGAGGKTGRCGNGKEEAMWQWKREGDAVTRYLWNRPVETAVRFMTR